MSITVQHPDKEPAESPGAALAATDALHKRRPRTLKNGDTFAVFDHNGDAISRPHASGGVYHRDTRYLSHFELRVGGRRPILLSSTLRDDNATLICDLTNPDFRDESGAIVICHDRIHLRRTRLLWNAGCFERLAIRNFDDHPCAITLELSYAADFADLFEVRGAHRARRGRFCAPQVHADGVTLGYEGLDGRKRCTSVRFDPAPASLSDTRALFDIVLKPREMKALFIEIRCDFEDWESSVRRSFFVALRDARRRLRRASGRAASLATSNEILNETIRRSISDIYTLITDTPQGPYPYAGIPWFSAAFGRDALITAWQMLWLDPGIARGVLRYLAANQAQEADPAADADPGKILHEVRHGEMAELGEVPFRRYYGSIDSTPLFVFLAGAYLERTGDLDTVRALWPHIEAAIAWIETYGDVDGDGFVEYVRKTGQGLINQGWKDSQDAIFHADGTLARGSIALAEVQAYVYGAWCAATEIAEKLGHHVSAARFRDKAQRLRRRFDESFYDAALGTYVLALDGDKKPCRVRASNAGHALLTGIAYAERVPAVVERLMAAPSFSGWGIRTLAATEARYNPMSYHNGSVWPHDNALIAAGFSRYGFRRQAAMVFEGLFAASTYIDLRRLPELFCGFARYKTRGPTQYPVACSPQAWAAAAPLSLVQSCLGLRFEPAHRHILFKEPILPDFINEVVLRGLTMGDASADVAIRRSGREVIVDVLGRRGGVRVLTVS